MLLLSDPQPEALIEEARSRQRQRARRRTAVLALAVGIGVLGFGIDQLARGGGSVQAAPSGSGAAPVSPPTVTYEKIVVTKIVPHLPVEKRTIETWAASNAPSTERQLVTIAGGPTLEIGSGPGEDKALGPLEVNYLYDASTNTIYRAGYYPVEASEAHPLRESVFKHVLAQPGVRLAGTRMYRGRPVYVVEVARSGVSETTFVDKRTYEPMFSEAVSTDLRTIVRTLAFKTLSATPANLALANLATAHPGARMAAHASPQIRGLYGKAAFLSGGYG